MVIIKLPRARQLKFFHQCDDVKYEMNSVDNKFKGGLVLLCKYIFV